jgi:aspartate carbamoyltransferase catalytic subunit
MSDNARRKHLLDVESLSGSEAEQFLSLAKTYHDAARTGHKKSDVLRGRTVINAFFEASTRTRSSFEIAGKRLSADVINIGSSQSSVTKGETLLDTARTLQAMHADALVIRHSASGSAHYLSKRLNCCVINAGDGTHEHPTQALLDAFTIKQRKGTFSGIKIAICGDITHSRVARSSAWLLRSLGASVCMAAPRTLLPSQASQVFQCPVFDKIEPALEGADVVMMLRIQKERLGKANIPSDREYAKLFGLSETRLRLARPDAMIMHPGPINRGVEINPELADHLTQSAILEQVEAGVAIRSAILDILLNRCLN